MYWVYVLGTRGGGVVGLGVVVLVLCSAVSTVLVLLYVLGGVGLGWECCVV